MTRRQSRSRKTTKSALRNDPRLRRILRVGKWLLCAAPLPFLFIGCATSPPTRIDNICAIFREKPDWYDAAADARERWGSPIPLTMAIIYQESSFDAYAKPPRRKILWLIPGPRLSNAYGYSQAKSETWRWYQEKSGNWGADRDDFDDAVDFVAWYNAQSANLSGIGSTDAYSMYLAYHEGHGGFNRRTYNNKGWLKTTARRVADRSNRYAVQLAGCESELQDRGWWPFW